MPQFKVNKINSLILNRKQHFNTFLAIFVQIAKNVNKNNDKMQTAVCSKIATRTFPRSATSLYNPHTGPAISCYFLLIIIFIGAGCGGRGTEGSSRLAGSIRLPGSILSGGLGLSGASEGSEGFSYCFLGFLKFYRR